MSCLLWWRLAFDEGAAGKHRRTGVLKRLIIASAAASITISNSYKCKMPMREKLQIFTFKTNCGAVRA
jgi:hypothetical protein